MTAFEIALVLYMLVTIYILVVLGVRLIRMYQERSAPNPKPRKCDNCGRIFISTLPEYSYERCWDCQGNYDWEELEDE